SSWFQFIRKTKSPELSVVLLEDSGAILGLLFALVGISAAAITKNGRFDAIGSLAIGLLLAAIAAFLAIENKSLLIGEAAEDNIIEAIHSAIVKSKSLTNLIHLRTLQLGPEDLLVAAKVDFDPSLEQLELITEIDNLEIHIRKAVPQARLIFIEP